MITLTNEEMLKKLILVRKSFYDYGSLHSVAEFDLNYCIDALKNRLKEKEKAGE